MFLLSQLHDYVQNHFTSARMALIGLGKLAIPCMSVCFFLRVVLLTDKHRKQTYGCQGAGRRGKIREFRINRCKLVYIGWINNRASLVARLVKNWPAMWET